MKKLLLTSCLALGITSGLFAGTITADGDVGGAAAAAGSVKVNFDDWALGSGTQSDGPLGNKVTVSFETGIPSIADAKVVNNATSGIFAAPYVSNLNGVGFDYPVGDGPNATNYLTTGLRSVTFTFDSKQNYFGLLWGSVDYYNFLDFWYQGNHVVTVAGTDVWAAANGDQGLNGTFYVNLFADAGVYYDKVVASSDGYAFEIDNVAYGVLSVPDSGATVALLGLSFACLFFFRRKAA